MTIISMPRNSLPHSSNSEESHATMVTLESKNRVESSSFVKFAFQTERTYGSVIDIQPWHLPPPNETIVPLSLNVSIPMDK